MRTLFATVAITAAALAAPPPPAAFVHHPTASFKLQTIEGHPVYLSPEAQADRALLDAVLQKLTADLKAIHTLLPAHAAARLASIAFWIEHDNPQTPGMTYHPSAEWLRQHGYNTDKAKGIEIGNLRHFLDWKSDQPLMVLHEMAHAYHDLVLGFDHVTVKWAFDLAVQSKKYESVAYVRGAPRRRAYALTNHKEYFAELTEAYWGRNDFQPFHRAELRAFDPPGFAMLEKLWLEPQ